MQSDNTITNMLEKRARQWPMVDAIRAGYGPHVVARPRENSQLIQTHPRRFGVKSQSGLDGPRQLDGSRGITWGCMRDRNNSNSCFAVFVARYRYHNGAWAILLSLCSADPGLVLHRKL